ncbi:MAG: hypothetical protein J7639_21125 [Paenibacillaceae bacterium]|nr:hypothetical protein [Paenibacillaceae bacterium]
MGYRNSASIAAASAATLGILALTGVFLYANGDTSADTKQIVLLALALPNALSLVTCLMRPGKLMFVLYALSLPAGLYLGLAALPVLWNLFLPLLIIQFIAYTAVRKRMRANP